MILDYENYNFKIIIMIDPSALGHDFFKALDLEIRFNTGGVWGKFFVAAGIFIKCKICNIAVMF
jgi:hypothetical protein